MRSRLSIIACTALLLVSPSAFESRSHAQTTQESFAPRQEVFAPASTWSPCMAPAGGAFAFLSATNNGCEVMVAPTDNPDQMRSVAHLDARPISLRWTGSPNILLAEVPAPKGNMMQVVKINLLDEQVTPMMPVHNASTRVARLSSARTSDALLEVRRPGTGKSEYFIAELDGAEFKPVAIPSGFANMLFDGAFKPRIASRANSNGTISLFKSFDGEWSEFRTIEVEDLLTTRPLGVTDDGQQFLTLDASGRDTVGLVSVDLVSGIERVLAADLDADIHEILLDPVTGAPQAAASTFSNRDWHIVDPAVKPMLRSIQNELNGETSVVTRSEDNGAWIARNDTPLDPPSFFLFMEGEEPVELFDSHNGALPVADAFMHTRTIESADGNDLLMHVSLPAGMPGAENLSPETPLPAIVLVHPGPWSRETLGFDPTRRWLVDRGYAVIQVNFRGSLGLGRNHLDAGDKEWSGTMHDDILSAVHWATSQRIIDSDRVAIFGKGFGGYAALVGVTFTPYTFAAGVSVGGPIDLVEMMHAASQGSAPMLAVLEQRIGSTRMLEDSKDLRERSPIAMAHRRSAPLFLAYAQNEPTGPNSSLSRFIESTTTKGVPLTTAVFNGYGDRIFEHEQNLALLGSIEQFLASTLGGMHEPLSRDERLANLQVTTIEGSASSIVAAPEE